MKIYLSFIHDRHTDPDAEVFTTAQAAIDDARRSAEEMSRGNGVVEETVEGYLYCAQYGLEECDCVWVVEKELREA